MTARAEKRPIVVTGCPRSGTTFVGKTLAASTELFYIYEPFNDDAPHHLTLPERFIALNEDNVEPYRNEIASIMALGDKRQRLTKAAIGALQYKAANPALAPRLAARELAYKRAHFFGADRVCVKDPLAFFAAEWMSDAYDAQVVVMVRHPASVISSYLALDWPSEIDAILTRPIPSASEDLTATIAAFRDQKRANLDGLILQWRMFTEATLELKRRRPDWLFVVHDALCMAPGAYFKAMFDYLDLTFTPAIRARIEADTSDKNVVDAEQHSQHQHQRKSADLVDAWRTRLDPEIADRILAETGDLWREAQDAIAPPKGVIAA